MSSYRVLRYLVLPIALVAIGMAQNPGGEFSIAINGPTKVKAGAPVVLNITFTNVSEHQIIFSGEISSVLGERNFRIDVLDGVGKPVTETRYMKAIRGENQGPGQQLYLASSAIELAIQPGKMLNQSADLSKLFELKPGKYTVRVSQSDFQRHNLTQILSKPGDDDLHKPQLPSAEKMSASPAASEAKALVKSNTLTFTVVQ